MSTKTRRRATAVGMPPGTNLPAPDGEIDEHDRAQLVGVYSSSDEVAEADIINTLATTDVPSN
jgi:hypothetical protein